MEYSTGVIWHKLQIVNQVCIALYKLFYKGV